MTVMVINKITTATPVSVHISGFGGNGSAQVFRLASASGIQALPSLAWHGGVLADTAPGQSVTLYVLPKG